MEQSSAAPQKTTQSLSQSSMAHRVPSEQLKTHPPPGQETTHSAESWQKVEQLPPEHETLHVLASAHSVIQRPAPQSTSQLDSPLQPVRHTLSVHVTPQTAPPVHS